MSALAHLLLVCLDGDGPGRDDMDADSPGEDRVTDSGGPQVKGVQERDHDIRVALEGGQAARQSTAHLAVYNDKG